MRARARHGSIYGACGRLYPSTGKSIENSHPSFSRLGVVRRRVCLCCVSRTRARVGREARACAARTRVTARCAVACVRVCVVCFATRVGAVGATRAPLLATFEEARTCYGNSTSWFDSYTLLEALPREATRTIVRNTLRWTTAHGSRLCIWNVRGDRSRKSSWSKIIAVLEGLACSKARWAMWFDADAVIQNADISPTKVLAEIERHLGSERFANVDIVFSSEFGDLKEKGNPINAGVFLYE